LLAQRPALDLVLTDQYMPDGDGWLVLESVAEFMPQVLEAVQRLDLQGLEALLADFAKSASTRL
jgi:CheY-like chemotaxis protein